MNEEKTPSDYPIKDGIVRYKAFEAPKPIELDLVIKHLEKELERQNLLIATDENIKRNKLNFDVLPSDVYKHMYDFRDELEKAITILKTKQIDYIEKMKKED